MKTSRSETQNKTNRFDIKSIRHPFLDGLSDEQLLVLRSCAMPVEFDEGEYVFKKGHPANRFYCITEGKVELIAVAELGKDVVIQTIGAGDLLGWSWMCPPFEWAFDARAKEPTKAVFFYATPLREHCENDPALGYELMKRISLVIMDRLQATRRMLLQWAGPHLNPSNTSIPRRIDAGPEKANS